MRLGAVILAAGYSSRMVGFKPLMPLKGQSLFSHCVRLFQLVGVDKIVVVTGHRNKELVAPAEKLGVRCIHNHDFAEGMFASVCTGLSHMAGVDGFFMLPVDIPLIRPATLDLLSSHFSGDGVVYPVFEGERGHPPLISAQMIPALLEHDGQGGLEALLEKFPCKDIPVWDQGILMDADTPQDFTALVERSRSMDMGTSAEAKSLASITMPTRGVAHGQAVAGIACTFGRELNRNGMNLDLDVLHNGALLHDIAKGHPDHEACGANMLRTLGLGRLAECVGAHRDAEPPVSGTLTEKELVCLADKLVRGTKRMSVKKRFSEKLKQYANDSNACLAIRQRLANALALQHLVERAAGKTVENILCKSQQ